MDIRLLMPNEAVVLRHESEACRAWVEYARGVLAAEGDKIIFRSLDERISLAAASYGFWLERLNFPQTDKPSELKEITEQLPDDQKELLADDLRLQSIALGSVKAPDEFYNFMNDIGYRAYAFLMKTEIAKELLPVWGDVVEKMINKKTGNIGYEWFEKNNLKVISDDTRQHLDSVGVTHDKCVKLMSEASKAMNNAYIEVMAELGIEDNPNPMEVRGFKWKDATQDEKVTQFGVKHDRERKVSFYRVSDMSNPMIDPRSLFHISFHEPLHKIQSCLGKLYKGGKALPDFLKEANRVVNINSDYGVRDHSPDILSVSNKLRELAHASYASKPKEETALYQGYLAEMNFAMNHINCLKSNTRKRLSENPNILQRMPPEIMNWYNKFYGNMDAARLGKAGCAIELKR